MPLAVNFIIETGKVQEKPNRLSLLIRDIISACMSKSLKRGSKPLTSLKNIAIVKLRMLKKFALVSSWFLVTPILIISLLVMVNSLNNSSYLSEIGPSVTAAGTQENTVEGQVLSVKIEDMRPYYVSNFLKGRKLEPYSQLMVETADKYSLDYRLIPAIAMKESGGGNTIDEETHNAWGWENGKTNFSSWEQAINTVAKTLKENYIDKGLITPEQIMAVYAPPQLETGGKWAKDINYFYSQMENL
jgi:hypothetical protein